eukprot:5464142-Pyramimonas_sp.AAC.1
MVGDDYLRRGQHELGALARVAGVVELVHVLDVAGHVVARVHLGLLHVRLAQRLLDLCAAPP